MKYIRQKTKPNDCKNKKEKIIHIIKLTICFDIFLTRLLLKIASRFDFCLAEKNRVLRG